MLSMQKTRFRFINVPPKEVIENTHNKIVARIAVARITGDAATLERIHSRIAQRTRELGYDFYAAYQAATGHRHPLSPEDGGMWGPYAPPGKPEVPRALVPAFA